MIAEWDILAEIWAMRQELSDNRITLQHIKGRSDDNQAYNTLTLLQQLNVNMDKLADQYIQEIKTIDG
jgi:uncharacterized protein YsxB (DUF464 family)